MIPSLSESPAVADRLRQMRARLGCEARCWTRVLFGFDDAIWAKLPLAIGIFYLIGPIDLIPWRTHWYGFIDELGIFTLGLVLARVVTPEGPEFALLPPGMIARWQFRLRILQADLGNFYLLQHRREDGFVITAKNSGSHWLKAMLNHALAAEWGVAPPPFSTGPSADYLVGRGGMAKPHAHLPHFAMSHTIPSAFFAWRYAFRLVPRRPVVVLVRNIEAALCSNYCKWGAQYGVDLDAFMRGDPTGKRHVADVWWYMHFMNRWRDVAEAHPGLVLVVHYEELERDPGAWLARIARHLGVRLRPEALAAGLRMADRAAMRAAQDPGHDEIVVPELQRRRRVQLSERNRQALRAVLRRHLRHAP